VAAPRPNQLPEISETAIVNAIKLISRQRVSTC
jgi:hypothetical protein